MKTIPLLLTFLLMGIADAMGPMSSGVQANFQLSSVMATLMPFFVFIAFALFSVPGGVLAAHIGKKKVLVLGLALNTLALGVPALFQPGYISLLGCIFLLGVGTTFLQVAGNPLMRDVSAAGEYGRNLALAQGSKGLGSSASSFLVTAVSGIPLLSSMGWRGAFPIFFVLMLLALILVINVKIDETRTEVPPSISSSLALLGEPVFAFAVLGIFLYVGAEVSMGTFLKPTLVGLGMEEKEAALFGPTLFFSTLTVGRLLAGSIKVRPRSFFRWSALLGLVGTVLIILGNIPLVLVGVVLGGLGFANIWPMLFSITIEGKPERASELSGLMCMAISGGALVPLLMGKLIDNKWNTIAYVVPAFCFGYLLLLSLRGDTKRG